jgi:polyisoprenoid-binding protein YceI
VNRRWIIAATIALIVIGAAVFATWWFMFRETAPDPASLEGARQAVSTSTTEAAGPGTEASPATTAPATTAAPAAVSAGIEGDWTIRSDGSSFVGYRVREELAGIGAKTAAGRTGAVGGGVTIAGNTVTAVDIQADLTGLESDDSRRDGAIRRQALETEAFPTAGFVTTEPIELPAGAAAGDPVSTIATGDLTLHGVTRTVEIPIDAQLVDGVIVMAGSLEVVFADFDIEKPQSPILLSVEDRGLMEFELVLDAG